MDLKARTASTLRWNLVDRLATQVLYALTGIVLARLLTPEDFGLVGAVLVFQAFCNILVDSGFSYALIQKKEPSETDYSTVLWFNLLVGAVLYVGLWFAAPLVADCFQGDQRLVGLSRVLFLSLLINGSCIVQVNRLMKRMDVRMVALSNALGLGLGGVSGIALALWNFGAWAIVWQTLVSGAVRSLVLWTTSRWWPQRTFSWVSLRAFFGIGSRMMATSFLNTLFLNIYSFFIGNRVGLGSLGYYTQADKWSKMGITSITQIATSTFLPVLSALQDDARGFAAACSKMNRFTAYVVFPAMCGLCVCATPLFHVLFGTKWDAAIILFQLLLVRGIFVVLASLWNNFLLARGLARRIFWLEVFRDAVALLALGLTFPYLVPGNTDNATDGVMLLINGQLIASALTTAVTLVITSRGTGIGIGRYLLDLLPYLGLTAIACVAAWAMVLVTMPDWLLLLSQLVVGAGVYLGLNALTGSKIQKDAIEYAFSRRGRKC